MFPTECIESGTSVIQKKKITSKNFKCNLIYFSSLHHKWIVVQHDLTGNTLLLRYKAQPVNAV
jgi:hypothetical protein